MPSLEEEYRTLLERLAKLREVRAGLVALEQQKTVERDALILELKAFGINTDALETEVARLEQEAADGLKKATDEVEKFELQLSALGA